MFSIGEGNWTRLRIMGAAVAGAVLVTLGHAGAAGAQQMTMCQSTAYTGTASDPAPFQRMLAEQSISAQVMVDAATAAVGAQYGSLWFNDARQGWSVAIVPGALDLDAAKAAIAARLSAGFTPDQAAFVTDRLSLWATPYTDAELYPIQNALFDSLLGLDQGWGLSAGISCVPADDGVDGSVDARRVVATLFTGFVEPASELVAQAQALGTAYGDKVRVVVRAGDGRVWPASGEVPGPLPVPAPSAESPKPPAAPTRAPAAPQVARYVSLPKAGRCVRARVITIKARERDDLRRLTVKAPSRTLSLAAGKHARIRLAAGKRTKLAVTVTTRDGRSASQTFTIRRCG